MNMVVYIVLLGWIPLVLVLFATMPPRRAVLVAYIGGVLFLPCFAFKLLGIPDYGRATASSLLTLAGAVLFDFGRVARFRPRLLDIPMAGYCVLPFFSSVHNGIGEWGGAYDGLSVTFHQVMMWGIPYFMGRLYIDDLDGQRELALGILIGCLIYVPLCLFESRMSPQLHRMVYGYHQHQFAQTFRFGGFRPVVFMEHGLAVGLWMAVGTVLAVWFWATGAVRRILNIPMGFVVCAIGATFLLCRSLGAVLLAAAGLGALFIARAMRLRLALLLLAAVPLVYIADRLSGVNAIDSAVHVAASISPERAASLQTRFTNESMLIDKALREPVIGWGGWGRSRVKDEDGNDMSITDGLWVIVLGTTGLVGLASLLGWQLGPPVSMIRRVRAGGIGSPEAAAPLALAVALLMVGIDALPNAPAVPVYTMISGGLVSLACALHPRRPHLRVRSGSPSECAAPPVAGAPVLD
jgi:hypothetical protein